MAPFGLDFSTVTLEGLLYSKPEWETQICLALCHSVVWYLLLNWILPPLITRFEGPGASEASTSSDALSVANDEFAARCCGPSGASVSARSESRPSTRSAVAFHAAR